MINRCSIRDLALSGHEIAIAKRQESWCAYKVLKCLLVLEDPTAYGCVSWMKNSSLEKTPSLIVDQNAIVSTQMLSSPTSCKSIRIISPKGPLEET